MKIAIVDDEKDMRQSISQWLALSGYDTETFASAEEALKVLGADYPGIVISDIKMPGMDGMQFLKKLMGNDSALPVIMITGHGDVPMAVEAMRVGAFDFLEKPFNPDRMTELAKKATNARRLTLDNRALRRELVGWRPADEKADRRQPRDGAAERGYSGSGAGRWPCADRRRNRHRQDPGGACACTRWVPGRARNSCWSPARRSKKTRLLKRLFGPMQPEDASCPRSKRRAAARWCWKISRR